MPNEDSCHSPALHDMNLRYFHNRIQAIATFRTNPIPQRQETNLSSTPSLKTVPPSRWASHRSSTISVPQSSTPAAPVFIYAVQIASQNVERKQDIPPLQVRRRLSLSSDGEMTAPQLRICEDADLCSTCHLRDTCTELALPEARTKANTLPIYQPLTPDP